MKLSKRPVLEIKVFLEIVVFVYETHKYASWENHATFSCCVYERV